MLVGRSHIDKKEFRLLRTHQMFHNITGEFIHRITYPGYRFVMRDPEMDVEVLRMKVEEISQEASKLALSQYIDRAVQFLDLAQTFRDVVIDNREVLKEVILSKQEGIGPMHPSLSLYLILAANTVKGGVTIENMGEIIDDIRSKVTVKSADLLGESDESVQTMLDLLLMGEFDEFIGTPTAN